MIDSSYLVIKSTKLEETAEFYKKLFGFEETFATDWYISLKTGEQELAILEAGHESIPEAFRDKTTGAETIINFETKKIDQIYEKVQELNIDIHLELRDEPWGQRHFIATDPNNIAIDVIKNIPPSQEYQASYQE